MALRDSDPAEVGGYRIEDRLGSGGMGVVYLARSASGRPLAIKVVHGQYADDDEFRARFRREVAAARQVSGAFTAPVVDADADAMRPWMATLYIPGADLGTHVREHGPLPLPRLRELAAGLAEALRDMHRAGVVHRDLKPANVMLADDGPRVIDFGISRAAEFAASDVLTQTGRVMGTPPFMSPEQFASPQDVGPAADVFSLGSVLAYAATRRGPFDSPSPYETALRVVEGEPELSGVPDEMLPVIRLCLKKHHKSRPTAADLLTLLREGSAPAGHPLPATGSPRTLRPGPGARPTEPAGTVWPDAARTDRAEAVRPPLVSDRTDTEPGEAPHRRLDRTPAEQHEPPHDPAAAPAPDAERVRRRRRHGLMLVSAAAAVVLAALVTTTMALIPDGDRAPSSEAAPADLPEGWKPWAARAKGPEGGRMLPGDSSFRRCAAVDTSLVCAGAQIMATRFDLADGGPTWTRFVDPTAPDGVSNSPGGIIGTSRDRVYAYQADERQMADGAGPLFTYSVAALAAGTGEVLWRTETADGQMASAPDREQGSAVAVPEGVVTFYGGQGDQYALLAADTGKVLWKRPQPQAREGCRLRAADRRAYLICTDGDRTNGTARTSVSQLGAATGEPRWTVEAKGALDMLGRDGNRLVLADAHAPGSGLTRIDLSSRALTTLRLSGTLSDASAAYLVRGTVYLTRGSGGVSAVSPRTGRTRWVSNSTVEQQGPPTASATHVYFASPSGRVAALSVGTGKVEGTRTGRDDSGEPDNTTGAPLTLVGDALYIPYGERSVYTVDVRDL
ncbi:MULTISPECIES: protein kinase domain-containing protein [Streptomyces]|uniref:non-specific serine/threonine protein kinase n=1 Tax=Streptomyces chartreusis NRRL 3882 TaxID=1079985 RepID=A0A2N9BEQ8_STRCX|nr:MULTISPECIES: serine/threonine-protein kinase [Streptomyces]MYS95256.1 protein kinase [Streptomyces sp. SID5464]SOR81855.1 Serine/threonine-protein kinase AfsK [Streptomyces chartreusis NRRL 3882]